MSGARISGPDKRNRGRRSRHRGPAPSRAQPERLCRTRANRRLGEMTAASAHKNLRVARGDSSDRSASPTR